LRRPYTGHFHSEGSVVLVDLVIAGPNVDGDENAGVLRAQHWPHAPFQGLRRETGEHFRAAT
jgi:hypothetical protein